MKTLSYERGNSYEVEKKITKSPITHQFLKLCSFINVHPKSILTGFMCPFRGNEWSDFNNKQKKIGLDCGKEFSMKTCC